MVYSKQSFHLGSMEEVGRPYMSRGGCQKRGITQGKGTSVGALAFWKSVGHVCSHVLCFSIF